jgi:hypothetical protein
MAQRKQAKKVTAKRRRGAPSIFTQALADAVCLRVAQGESLRNIGKDPKMPGARTVREWVVKNEKFAQQYAHAKALGLDEMAEQIIELADTIQLGKKTKTNNKGENEVITGDMIEHRRLQIDTRKWYLSKLAPKIYGNQLKIEQDNNEALIELLKSLAEKLPV